MLYCDLVPQVRMARGEYVSVSPVPVLGVPYVRMHDEPFDSKTVEFLLVQTFLERKRAEEACLAERDGELGTAPGVYVVASPVPVAVSAAPASVVPAALSQSSHPSVRMDTSEVVGSSCGSATVRKQRVDGVDFPETARAAKRRGASRPKDIGMSGPVGGSVAVSSAVPASVPAPPAAHLSHTSYVFDRFEDGSFRPMAFRRFCTQFQGCRRDAPCAFAHNALEIHPEAPRLELFLAAGGSDSFRTPSGRWRAHWSDEHGDVFFVHLRSGQSQWEPP